MTEHDDRRAIAADIIAIVREEFPGTTAQMIRPAEEHDPGGHGAPAVLVTIPPDAGRFDPHDRDADFLDQDILGLDRGLPGTAPGCPDEMPADMAARIEVGIARVMVDRAEEDLVVVTRTLPGPAAQQAEAQARLTAAREDLLLKEAELSAQGFDRRP